MLKLSTFKNGLYIFKHTANEYCHLTEKSDNCHIYKCKSQKIRIYFC